MSSDMKKYLQLLESAKNPLDVKVQKPSEDDDIDAEYILTLRDGILQGELHENDDGSMTFKNANRLFDQYEGMDFDDKDSAENFFISMTTNDEFYESDKE